MNRALQPGPTGSGMNELLFGVFLNPSRDRLASMLSNSRAAEQAGFDYVSVQDHPYVGEFLDPLVLIGALIGQTDRIRFMTNVSNLPLRPPALLAKAAASLDALSGGRFELGLGGGRAWDRIAALGGPTWTPPQVVQAVDEAITISRYLWYGEAEGVSDLKLFSLGAVTPGPAPAHRIGIWLGASGPRMLNLLGRRADGWIAPLATGFDTKPAAQERIDRAAIGAGREPGDIRRVIQLVGAVTDRPETQQRPLRGPGNQPLRTTPEIWAKIIAEFVADSRFDTVNFIPQHEAPEQIAAFGEHVIPLARAAIQRQGAPTDEQLARPAQRARRRQEATRADITRPG
jgi:alkanesulfonate monooxygenase SsuD/methylene tetrahydromethanopterin reductase-like flavin-dependent oxidoreductase (luciferase family)